MEWWCPHLGCVLTDRYVVQFVAPVQKQICEKWNITHRTVISVPLKFHEVKLDGKNHQWTEFKNGQNHQSFTSFHQTLSLRWKKSPMNLCLGPASPRSMFHRPSSPSSFSRVPWRNGTLPCGSDGAFPCEPVVDVEIWMWLKWIQKKLSEMICLRLNEQFLGANFEPLPKGSCAEP